MIFLNWKLKTTVKGHPFMTSKKNHVFDPPPPCPHGPPLWTSTHGRQMLEYQKLHVQHSGGATATLVHAFVTSRLDYCSTLYVGLPAVRLGCLERVIRAAARLIGGIPRTGHVSAY